MTSTEDPVAVIGLSCRLPKARDAREFWRLLAGGRDAVGRAPLERLRRLQDEPGARFGAFLDEVDEFDAEFFGISPREAASMDPRQRLMLELCWKARKDAGTWRPRAPSTQPAAVCAPSRADS